VAFWDDLYRNITGGGNAKPAPKAAPSPLKKASKPAMPTEARASTPSKFAPVSEPSAPEDRQRQGGGSFATGKQEVRDAVKPIDSNTSFFDQMGQGLINSGAQEAERGNDTVAWLTEEVNSPDEFFVPAFGSAARTEQKAVDEAEGRRVDGLNRSFGSAAGRTVRELSPEEWGTLSPDQQEGVIASWALYRASLEDQQLAGEVGKEDYQSDVASVFGDRGTEQYAPNTIRVLQELGYTSNDIDADAFVTGGAIPTYEDILGQSTGSTADARRGVYENLAGSTLFDSETIVSSLANGQGLLDTLRNAGTVSSDFKRLGGVTSDVYGSLGDEDYDYLNTILKNLAYKPVFDRLGSEPDLNDRLSQSINEANATYGPEVVTQYFLDSVRGFEDPNFMNADEFRANWLGG